MGAFACMMLWGSRTMWPQMLMQADVWKSVIGPSNGMPLSRRLRKTLNHARQACNTSDGLLSSIADVPQGEYEQQQQHHWQQQQQQWLKLANLTEQRVRTSLCVPCAPEDVPLLSNVLLPSVQAQSFQPAELVISLSGTSPQAAEGVRVRLQEGLPGVPVVMASIPDAAYAGQNRNRAANHSSHASELLVFADADDALHPRRLELMARTFAHFRAKVSLAGYSLGVEGVDPLDDPFQVVLGQQIISQGGLQHLGELRHRVHQGQPSVDRRVFERVQQKELARGQDVAFLQDVMKEFGPHDNTIVYIGQPLVRFGNWRTGR